MTNNIKQAYIEENQASDNLLSALNKANIPFKVTSPEKKPHYRSGKRHLVFTDKKGESMDTCATISDKYICCNVKVLKSVSNCPYDCSYCFLQNYLNDGNLKSVANHQALIDEVTEKCQAEPNRLFRIGTWELGDSLALENETGQAQHLIKAFSTIPNAMLELKTKSAIVDPILNCDHQQKTVVSWSLNANTIINSQEHKTARLTERLQALTKVTNAGYLVGLHFDPMLLFEQWQTEYSELIEQTIAATNPSQIAWISIGSLRFNPEMKQKIEQNFPQANITYQEMIKGNDGKMRYPKPTRIKMYKHVLNQLKDALNCNQLSPLSPPQKNKPLFYFCMERWDIWENLLGESPRSIEELDYLFAHSLTQRFNLNMPPQTKAIYHC